MQLSRLATGTLGILHDRKEIWCGFPCKEGWRRHHLPVACIALHGPGGIPGLMWGVLVWSSHLDLSRLSRWIVVVFHTVLGLEPLLLEALHSSSLPFLWDMSVGQ